MRGRRAWLVLAGALLAGCAAGPRADVEAMAAAAAPPGEAVRSRLLAEDVRAVLPADLRGVEVSNVAVLPNGVRWVCLRGTAGGPAGQARGFTGIVLLSADSTLVGTQADCPSCRAAALGWQPFPALDDPGAPLPWSARLDGAAPLGGS